MLATVKLGSFEWQPITTAPKDLDGRKFIVWGRTWSRCNSDGKDNVDNWDLPEPHLTYSVGENGICLVDAAFVSGESAECRATHWAPVEAPNKDG